MMLDMSFGMKEEANAIDRAVNSVLSDGYRTADIAGEGVAAVSTSEMGKMICERI